MPDCYGSREERGANTEPTGLGMERWFALVTFAVVVPFSLITFTGPMGWGGAQVVGTLLHCSLLSC